MPRNKPAKKKSKKKKPAEPKFGERKSYAVKDWVWIRGCKHILGQVEAKTKLGDYDVRLMDGDLLTGIRPKEMKPWNRKSI